MNTIKKEYSCCAVFVSYNPEYSIIDNVNQLVNQVTEILIVDNNSSENSRRFLLELDKIPRITIIYNKDNLGIASALNQGVRYAIQYNYEWIATFDQDSNAPGGFIESMLDTYDRYSYQNELAIISPRYLDPSSGLISPDLIEGSNGRICEINSTMTSGNLVKMNIFEKVGLFEEDFFIDYVDHEFCLRCLLNNLKVIISSESILIHNLGNITSHELFGKIYFTSNHSSVRRFYNARNRVLLYRRYLFAKSTHSTAIVRWILHDVLVFLKATAKICLFEDDKIAKITLVIKGVYNGLLDRKGKYQ